MAIVMYRYPVSDDLQKSLQTSVIWEAEKRQTKNAQSESLQYGTRLQRDKGRFDNKYKKSKGKLKMHHAGA